MTCVTDQQIDQDPVALPTAVNGKTTSLFPHFLFRGESPARTSTEETQNVAAASTPGSGESLGLYMCMLMEAGPTCVFQICGPDLAADKDVPEYIPQLLVVGTPVTGNIHFTCTYIPASLSLTLSLSLSLPPAQHDCTLSVRVGFTLVE